MSSMKSLFIAILLIVCLHVISSLASPNPYSDNPYPLILTNIAGKQMRPGQKVSLKIHSSSKTIVDIHILQKNTFLDQVLATNVTLYVGYNKVKFRIPLSGNFVKPSPLNYFAIVENEFSVDHSATFRIGHPGFGLTIRKPVAGDVIKLGNILKVRWKGSYVPPCANSSTFRVERCLIKQTIVRDAEEDVGEIWFIEGQNLNFTTGGLDFETSFMVPNLYKFACIIINKVNGNEFQYSSGTFLVIR